MGRSFIFNGVNWESMTSDSSGLAVDLISKYPVDLNSDVTTIDGVDVADGMTVLLAKQTEYLENGVYQVMSNRLTIMAEYLINVGTIVVATEGMELKGSNWVCFYMGGTSWTPGVETAWHDMRYLAHVAAIAKVPVRFAMTRNVGPNGVPAGLQLPIGSPPLSLTDGDRILLTAQSDQTYNGIWNAHAGPWTRAEDMSVIGDLIVGTQVNVTSGYLKKTSWTCGQIGTMPWRPGVINTWYSDTSLTHVSGDIQLSVDNLSASIIHLMGTTDVSVQVYDVDTKETVAVKVLRRDLNVVEIEAFRESFDPISEIVTVRVIVSSSYGNK